MDPVTGDTPLHFDAMGLKGVSAVRYWTPAAQLRNESDGTIASTDLGRVDVGRKTHALYPPVSGWPAALGGSRFIVECVIGIDDADVPAARAAVATAVRHLYDGYREIRPDASFVKLSRALRL